MGRIEDLEKEVNGLKRKLNEENILYEKMEELIEEKDDLLSESNKEKHEMNKKINKLQVTKTKFHLLKVKVRKQDHLLSQVSDKVECPVCYEVPRSGPVPVCPNGHFVCKKCRAKTTSCPTCRTAMGDGKSLLATTIIESIEHNCKFVECDEKFPLEGIENHEAVCPFRLVDCLSLKCKAKIPLCNLVDHLLKSDVCSFQKEIPSLTQSGQTWIHQAYKIGENIQVSSPAMDWPVSLYTFDGQYFAVFPVKTECHFYVQVVILATEIECSNYKFEAVLHAAGFTVSESTLTARFEGTPVPINMYKEDLKLFVFSEKFMDKLMKKSRITNTFSLSFTMSKA